MNRARAIQVLAQSIDARVEEMVLKIATNLIDKFIDNQPEHSKEFSVDLKLVLSTDLLYEIERHCIDEKKERKYKKLLLNRFKNGRGLS